MRLSASTWLILATVVAVVLEAAVGFPGWARDLLRAVALVEVAAVIVITVLVARRYFINFQADPTKARLLPRHVVRLGLGTLGLSLVAAALLVSLIGEPFLWHGTPLALPALTVLLAGLWDMVRWLPNRTAPPTNDGRRGVDRPGHNEKGAR